MKHLSLPETSKELDERIQAADQGDVLVTLPSGAQLVKTSNKSVTLSGVEPSTVLRNRNDTVLGTYNEVTKKQCMGIKHASTVFSAIGRFQTHVVIIDTADMALEYNRVTYRVKRDFLNRLPYFQAMFAWGKVGQMEVRDDLSTVTFDELMKYAHTTYEPEERSAEFIKYLDYYGITKHPLHMSHLALLQLYLPKLQGYDDDTEEYIPETLDELLKRGNRNGVDAYDFGATVSDEVIAMLKKVMFHEGTPVLTVEDCFGERPTSTSFYKDGKFVTEYAPERNDEESDDEEVVGWMKEGCKYDMYENMISGFPEIFEDVYWVNLHFIANKMSMFNIHL